MATKEIALTKDIGPLVLQAKSLEITDEKSLTGAVEFLSKLNSALKTVTKEKEKVTKPLNEALKAERARFKPYETQLEEAILLVRREMTSYQTAQKCIAEESAAKIAARVGEGKGKLSMETAVRQMEDIDKPVVSVETTTGSVKFKTAKKFEVMDVTMLPVEYLLANEVAIRKAMLVGEELPGVRYYEEEIPVNSL